MKFITYGENTIIKADAVDCIDIYFNKDGTYFYIDLLLHGATKQIEYKNTNAAFLKLVMAKTLERHMVLFLVMLNEIEHFSLTLLVVN